MSAYVVDATVTHRRTRPLDYSFEHRTTTWLVDRDTAATRATLEAAVDLLVSRYAVVP